MADRSPSSDGDTRTSPDGAQSHRNHAPDSSEYDSQQRRHSRNSAAELAATAEEDAELVDFLTTHVLQQYADALRASGIRKVEHLADVQETDCEEMGMTKFESRRLLRVYEKWKKHRKSTIPKRLVRMLGGSSSASGAHGGTACKGKTSATAGQATSESPAPVANVCLIHPQELLITQPLGKGSFGTVNQAVWTMADGVKRTVAVKTLDASKDKQLASRFIKEANILHQVSSHPHIIQLLGIGIDSLMLVTELAPEGSLLSKLRQRPMPYSVMRLYLFAEQVADAMVYLERKGLVHRDLAARNVLLMDGETAKISDFGLSRMAASELTTVNRTYTSPVPVAWTAPEAVAHNRFSHKSDVWSYAVTTWEMFSEGLKPYEGKQMFEIVSMVQPPTNYRLPRPKLCSPQTYDLLRLCWHENPDKRPDFRLLKDLIQSSRPPVGKVVSSHKPGRVGCEGELALTKGETVVIIDRSDATAYFGQNSQLKTGTFPAGRVHIQQQDTESAASGKSKLSSGSPAAVSAPAAAAAIGTLIDLPTPVSPPLDPYDDVIVTPSGNVVQGHPAVAITDADFFGLSPVRVTPSNASTASSSNATVSAAGGALNVTSATASVGPSDGYMNMAATAAPKRSAAPQSPPLPTSDYANADLAAAHLASPSAAKPLAPARPLRPPNSRPSGYLVPRDMTENARRESPSPTSLGNGSGSSSNAPSPSALTNSGSSSCGNAGTAAVRSTGHVPPVVKSTATVRDRPVPAARQSSGMSVTVATVAQTAGDATQPYAMLSTDSRTEKAAPKARHGPAVASYTSGHPSQPKQAATSASPNTSAAATGGSAQSGNLYESISQGFPPPQTQHDRQHQEPATSPAYHNSEIFGRGGPPVPANQSHAATPSTASHLPKAGGAGRPLTVSTAFSPTATLPSDTSSIVMSSNSTAQAPSSFSASNPFRRGSDSETSAGQPNPNVATPSQPGLIAPPPSRNRSKASTASQQPPDNLSIARDALPLPMQPVPVLSAGAVATGGGSDRYGALREVTSPQRSAFEGLGHAPPVCNAFHPDRYVNMDPASHVAPFAGSAAPSSSSAAPGAQYDPFALTPAGADMQFADVMYQLQSARPMVSPRGPSLPYQPGAALNKTPLSSSGATTSLAAAASNATGPIGEFPITAMLRKSGMITSSSSSAEPTAMAQGVVRSAADTATQNRLDAALTAAAGAASNTQGYGGGNVSHGYGGGNGWNGGNSGGGDDGGYGATTNGISRSGSGTAQALWPLPGMDQLLHGSSGGGNQRRPSHTGASQSSTSPAAVQSSSTPSSSSSSYPYGEVLNERKLSDSSGPIDAEKIRLIEQLMRDAPGHTRQDCTSALATTQWNVKSALSYMCVQELLTLGIPGVNAAQCLRALEHSAWKVDRAAEWLLQLQDGSVS